MVIVVLTWLVDSCANRPSVYYHAILLIFRPFLVAEALAEIQQKHGIMWLREACRHATDAAQDSLVFVKTQQNASKACKVCTPNHSTNTDVWQDRLT
jgi:hypothetical protein